MAHWDEHCHKCSLPEGRQVLSCCVVSLAMQREGAQCLPGGSGGTHCQILSECGTLDLGNLGSAPSQVLSLASSPCTLTTGTGQRERGVDEGVQGRGRTSPLRRALFQLCLLSGSRRALARCTGNLFEVVREAGYCGATAWQI